MRWKSTGRGDFCAMENGQFDFLPANVDDQSQGEFFFVGQMRRFFFCQKLRSHAVLVAAVREGRRFLLQFCKDFLRRSELKRFAEHSKLALGVVLNVRDGNRKLQDIVNAAKVPLLYKCLTFAD